MKLLPITIQKFLEAARLILRSGVIKKTQYILKAIFKITVKNKERF